MHPELLRLSIDGNRAHDLVVHSYGTVLIFAILAPFVVVAIATRRDDRLLANTIIFASIAPIIAAIGARAAFVVTNWNFYSEAGFGTSLSRGGLTFWGVLVALIVAFIGFARVRKLGLVEAFATADVLVIALPIAQAIGRLGCLAAGCCYGRPSFHIDASGDVVADFPLALQFPEGSLAFIDIVKRLDADTAQQMTHAHATVPLIPFQLLDSVANVAIAIVLVVLATRARFAGQVTCAYGVMSAVVVVVGDTLRGEERQLIMGVVSPAQLVALVIGIAAVASFFALRARSATRA